MANIDEAIVDAIQHASNALCELFVKAFGSDEEEIRIVKKGRRITSAYYVNGKCIRHGNAKCSKEDKFNFEYGSKLAFKRMWGDPNA
jgi:hypothetical protein